MNHFSGKPNLRFLDVFFPTTKKVHSLKPTAKARENRPGFKKTFIFQPSNVQRHLL